MKHAEWRLRGIPAPLWRKVRSKAGDNLQRVLIGLLAAYAEGKIDPLSENDPVATARGALGGQARANKLSPERRSEIARQARAARTDLARTSLDVIGGTDGKATTEQQLPPAEDRRALTQQLEDQIAALNDDRDAFKRDRDR